LAEHVEFMESPIFGAVHIEVGDGESFGHLFQGGLVVQGLFGDNDTAGMDGEVVGKVDELLAVVEDMFGPGVQVGVVAGQASFLGGSVFDDGVYFARL